MPRKYPTKNVDVIARVDIVPENVVSEYLTSKETNKLFLKPPGASNDETETFYSEARAEHKLMSIQLKEMIYHRKIQRAISKHRTHKLYMDQAKLQARLIAANDFIREFSEKKKAVQRKIQKERQIQDQLEKDIEIKINQVEDLREFREKILETANEYQVYESALDDALKFTKCPTVEQLIDKCDSMMLAQANIEDLNAILFKEFDIMRKRVVELAKNAQTVYKGLLNELNETNRCYQKAKTEAIRYEKILLKTKQAIIEQNRKRVDVQEAVYDIYVVLCKRRNIPTDFKRAEMTNILDFIKDEVEELQAILQEYYHPTM